MLARFGTKTKWRSFPNVQHSYRYLQTGKQSHHGLDIFDDIADRISPRDRLTDGKPDIQIKRNRQGAQFWSERYQMVVQTDLFKSPAAQPRILDATRTEMLLLTRSLALSIRLTNSIDTSKLSPSLDVALHTFIMESADFLNDVLQYRKELDHSLEEHRFPRLLMRNTQELCGPDSTWKLESLHYAQKRGDPFCGHLVHILHRQRAIVDAVTDRTTSLDRLQLADMILQRDDLLSQAYFVRMVPIDQGFYKLKKYEQQARSAIVKHDSRLDKKKYRNPRRIQRQYVRRILDPLWVHLHELYRGINEIETDVRELGTLVYASVKIADESGELRQRQTQLEAQVRAYRMQVARNIERELKDPKGPLQHRRPFRDSSSKYKKMFMTDAEWRAYKREKEVEKILKTGGDESNKPKGKGKGKGKGK